MPISISRFMLGGATRGAMEMSNRYVAPDFTATAFNCPHCNAYAKQNRYQLYYSENIGYKASSAFIVRCDHCDRVSYWLNTDGRPRIVHPQASTAAPPHADMPQDVAAIYREAAEIASSSYRAAAALLRLALQKLMPFLGERGSNINADIASLVSKGLPVRIQQALDLCRVVGNESVHPGEISDEDGPELVNSLFSMLNLIVEDRITRPKEIEALYLKLPENKRKGVEVRDSAKGAHPSTEA
ncbi:DUF4145 domain-containing protein [Stenotrophomonas maltophilia]|uniref:DUF4145 domain-containing protein n=1 Tax=Stenotrophomonas maltophilia TaxID=40324 RepID=UPI001C65AD5F|nr:DUF4145 domain-containing protein [Stenotrophomonas maltophilia]